VNLIRVAALDPGITTGYAKGTIKDGFMKVESHQAKWNHLDLHIFLITFQPNHIVCERFDFRQKVDKLELFSRELIGIVQLYTQIHKIEDKLYMQSAGEVLRGYYSNARLKEDGVYERGKPHANDAMRHLLHWYQFRAGYQFNQKGYGIYEPRP
jgi:hypothetical protein